MNQDTYKKDELMDRLDRYEALCKARAKLYKYSEVSPSSEKRQDDLRRSKETQDYEVAPCGIVTWKRKEQKTHNMYDVTNMRKKIDAIQNTAKFDVLQAVKHRNNHRGIFNQAIPRDVIALIGFYILTDK